MTTWPAHLRTFFAQVLSLSEKSIEGRSLDDKSPSRETVGSSKSLLKFEIPSLKG